MSSGMFIALIVSIRIVSYRYVRNIYTAWGFGIARSGVVGNARAFDERDEQGYRLPAFLYVCLIENTQFDSFGSLLKEKTVGQ